MTTVAILPVPSSEGVTSYCAVSGDCQASGQTVGQALDALAQQLSLEDAGTLVVVQHHQPDRFFTAEQRRHLEELMHRWRKARDVGASLTMDEQSELDSLVEAEIRAATQRAKAIADQVGS